MITTNTKFDGTKVKLNEKHRLSGRTGVIAGKWPQDDNMWEINLDGGDRCMAKKGTFTPINSDGSCAEPKADN